jgi:phenylacetate-coenzyme A ligase PaaK-like adenylate-forming protein
MSPFAVTRTLIPLGKRSRAAIENFRDRQIRELVAHAYANVPFYRQLYDMNGARVTKVRGFEDLPMLPVATRKDLQRAALGDLVAAGVDAAKLHVRRTNGTSNEPLGIRKTRAESRLLNQYYFQAFRAIGVRPRDLAVGTALPRPGEPVPRKSIYRRAANRIGFYPTEMILKSTPDAVISELMRLKPEIVGGLPGRLSMTMARASRAQRELITSAPWPRLVVTGGERLRSQVRTHLAETFGAPVIDMYSSVEFNLIASECAETGHYHVSDETVALEIVNGSDHVASGKVGNPVGTALHSFAAPIIRYPLGDLVTAGETTCSCGVNLSTIREIQGRSMDYFEFPDGTITHDQKIEEAVAHGAGWVRQIKISQPEKDRLLLRLAPLRDPSSDEVTHLRNYLNGFLENAIEIDIVLDPALGPENGDKM